MTIRIHADPLVHRLARPDADPRIAWTVCGKRFAWGSIPPGNRWTGKCSSCEVA